MDLLAIYKLYIWLLLLILTYLEVDLISIFWFEVIFLLLYNSFLLEIFDIL